MLIPAPRPRLGKGAITGKGEAKVLPCLQNPRDNWPRSAVIEGSIMENAVEVVSEVGSY
jgi:hypothetical protein